MVRRVEQAKEADAVDDLLRDIKAEVRPRCRATGEHSAQNESGRSYCGKLSSIAVENLAGRHVYSRLTDAEDDE